MLLSGYQFAVGGGLMVLAGLLCGARLHFTVPGAFLLLYLAFISSSAYTLWGVLLKYHPVSNVTVFNSLTPILGVILPAVILNEKNAITVFTVIALALVCLGIVIISSEKNHTE